MIHQHIKSLPHHPKRVIVISLIIALAIGIFGYQKINQKIYPPVVPDNSSTNNYGGNASVSNLTLEFLAGGRIASVSVKAGDKVSKGTVLATLEAENAQGALAQAQAAYETAKANYQKIINGATGSAIDVAKAAVHTAQVNLDGITKQQNILVQNAKTNLLNSTLAAKSNTDTSITPPPITGTYVKNVEGAITIVVNQGGTGGYFTIGGIENGTGVVNATVPEPIADTGLYIQFPAGTSYVGTAWEIDIPNTTAPNYLANYNAYQSALQSQSEAVAGAQANLDQANASLTALATTARPEDVAMAEAQMNNAQGAVEIAQAALQNTIITAPEDGTVVSVDIAPGQIATPNSPAIEFTSNVSVN
jgi:multidrug efflux pump subunit AcrA (membrane-fusion protein)